MLLLAKSEDIAVSLSSLTKGGEMLVFSYLFWKDNMRFHNILLCQATNPIQDRHTHFRSIASSVMDQLTSRRCFQGYLTRLAVRILDPLPVVTLSYPEQIQRLSVRGVFVSRVRLFGTCYLSIWDIWIFPLLCLKVNWKHFYSCEPSRVLLRLS